MLPRAICCSVVLYKHVLAKNNKILLKKEINFFLLRQNCIISGIEFHERLVCFSLMSTFHFLSCTLRTSCYKFLTFNIISSWNKSFRCVYLSTFLRHCLIQSIGAEIITQSKIKINIRVNHCMYACACSSNELNESDIITNKTEWIWSGNGFVMRGQAVCTSGVNTL